ncbi:MAG: hypothetical protein OQK05_05795 [Pseudopelagicola sp.]|nr:hypothetical protein [Pseudopelagicola sp.]
MVFGTTASHTGLGAAVMLAVASAASADTLLCTADTQCRGDAKRMCAPSTLQIAIKPGAGSGAQLWIDRQGPYAARVSRGKDGERRYELDAFAGRYTLDIEAQGRFLYVGNRGKRFTGDCGEAL